MEAVDQRVRSRSEAAKGTRAAGKRFEKKCQDFLTSLGWHVDKARAAVIWIKGKGGVRPISTTNDFWGCADLICVHPNKPFLLVVQCTIGTNVRSKLADLAQVGWNFDAQRPQVWMPMNETRGGMRTLGARRQEGGVLQTTEFLWRMTEGEEPAGNFL